MIRNLVQGEPTIKVILNPNQQFSRLTVFLHIIMSEFKTFYIWYVRHWFVKSWNPVQLRIHFCWTTDYYFEIDCQIIGSKHFLVSTRFSLKQKPIIISNLKFESTFWSLSIFLKKKEGVCKIIVGWRWNMYFYPQ